MSTEVSQIAEWYNGRSIFLTGGSGFMGKVLIEKLLYCCPKIKAIYILMRSKRGKNPTERAADMWKLPMFERLKKTQPEAHKKMIPVIGDLNTPDLGLSTSDIKTIIDNVSIVFHVGATLRLEAKLKDAIEQNTVGTSSVIDISKKIKNLKAFIYYSTAFCSADIDEFEERVYESQDDPRSVMEVTNWMRDDALNIATPELIKPHPNTYTYSKRLAETLVANEKDNLPVCIIRPSIVIPAVNEPLPGWVDTLNGPMGLLAAAGKGVVRSMHCKGSNTAHVIPVDYAINATIVITQQLASAKQWPKEVPVYNLTQNEVLHITWQEIIDRGRHILYEYPFEMQIWYPDGDIRSTKFMHNICCIFFHWLPALFIDLLLFVFMQKRFMLRLQKRIHEGLELLQFFTTREWVFKSSRFTTLWNSLPEIEKKTFSYDLKSMEIEDYLRISLLGTRQYCFKEDPSSLPMCRIRQKFNYVLNKLLVYGFYSYVIWFVYSRFLKSIL